MTDKSAAAIREFAEKIVPVILNSGLLCNTEEIIEAFTGDLTALISEHYTANEEVDKMVEEKLREELIAYDKYASRWIDNYRAETAEDCVDEYLKSKEQ